jgi:hypothetical protein
MHYKSKHRNSKGAWVPGFRLTIKKDVFQLALPKFALTWARGHGLALWKGVMKDREPGGPTYSYSLNITYLLKGFWDLAFHDHSGDRLRFDILRTLDIDKRDEFMDRQAERCVEYATLAAKRGEYEESGLMLQESGWYKDRAETPSYAPSEPQFGRNVLQ